MPATARRRKSQPRIAKFARSSESKILINANALAGYIKQKRCSIQEAADVFDLPLASAHRMLFVAKPNAADIERALNVYDMGYPIKDAALASRVSIQDIGKALQARNKQYKSVQVINV